jgi:uncharacterized protein involved in exopolysaccharide biosynthesis
MTAMKKFTKGVKPEYVIGIIALILIAAAFMKKEYSISASIIIDKPQVEVLELSESSKVAQLKHAETIKKVEAQKRARLVQGN